VGFVENNMVSRLDTTQSQVVVPHVEIGGSVVNKDAMEGVAVEVGRTVNGDTGGDEGAESTEVG
jgi:hypothetical protein